MRPKRTKGLVKTPTVDFEVPGPIYAYRRLRDRGGYGKYDKWKKTVLKYAKRAGFPGYMNTDKDTLVKLHIFVNWKKTPRMDLSNVLKGIEDALFRQDKYIIAFHAACFLDQPEESVSVVVRFVGR